MQLDLEGIHLEYKQGSGQLPKEFWPTYSAFANTSGGHVIFGVAEPKPQKYEVVGIQNLSMYKEQLFNNLNNPEKVSYNVVSESDVEEIEFEGKTLLRVYVKEAPYHKKPIFIKNNIQNSFKRVHEMDQRMSEEEIKYYIANSLESLDVEILVDFSIADLYEPDLNEYKRMVSEKTDIDYTSTSLEEFAKQNGILMPKHDNGKTTYHPTLASLLFFGKYYSILRKVPYFQLDYFRKNKLADIKWRDRVSSGDMNFPQMNIFSFYNAVLPKLYQSLEDRFDQDDGSMERTSYVSDMRAALREAFINSIMHAYYGAAEAIKITAYDDLYEFYNPGNMRVSKESFLMGGVSMPRNPYLTTCFRRIGLAERSGYGGQKILDVANRNKLRAPDVIDAETSTTIRLWKVDYLHTLPQLSDRAYKIYSYLYPLVGAKRTEIMENTGLTEHHLKAGTDELIELGLVKKIGNTRNTEYIVDLSPEMRISKNKKLIKSLEDMWRK